jgi:tetratricopeptide (TPR) repeat protein
VAVDPVTAGRELRVTHVLTGGFLIDNHKIRVNLELVDVARNEPVWRDEIEVSPQELIELRSQLAGRAAQGLLPALSIPGVLYGVPTPKNERAFTIYSHSLGISDDPGPNATAINMLEQSVSMDGEYAPPWEALTWRYYVDYAYGDGGPPALEKMRRAHARHAQLDPNGTANTITIRTEQGQLLEAYDEAANLLKRRPDASNAHFEMSYVLRYAGLADDASSECDAALAIDPGYAPYRSCGSIFTLGAADSVHAARYIQLDEGSGFGAMLRLEIDLRTGKTAAALNESRIAMQNGVPWATLVYRFLNHAPVEDLNKIAADIEADPKGARDSEVLYRDAAAFSFCGLKDAALRELRKAIAGSYCSYPAIDKDPLFDPIRQRPEFTSLRQSAIRCQANFRAHQNQSNSTSLAFSAGKN